jgi:hypothetical protein
MATAGWPIINRAGTTPLRTPTKLVLQWNADGLAEVGQVPRMLRVIEEQRPDYVCLSEIWARPASLAVPGYNLYASPPNRKGGVALLVKNSLCPTHLATLNLPGGQAVLATVAGGIIGSVYAPPRASAAELGEFIQVLKRYQGAMILAGDWNARAVEWSDIPSVRGDCLRNSRRLSVHAPLHRSFTSSRGDTSNIDLVVTAGRVAVIGVPELVYPGRVDHPGHRPVVTRIQWRAPGTGADCDRRIRPTRLKSPETHQAASEYYADHLPDIAAALEAVRGATDMDIWYNILSSTLREPFVEARRKPSRARPGWSRDLDQLRRAVKRLYDSDHRNESRQLGRWIQREYRKRTRERSIQLAQELVNETSLHRAAAIRRALNIAPRKKSAPEAVRKRFSASVCESERDRLPALVPVPFVVTEEFNADIRSSLQRVKVGRAAGPDGVYGEMIRVAEPWLRDILPDLWRLIGQCGHMPTLWRTQATEPAYKKGPTDDPASYRPIGIVPVMRSVIDKAFRSQMERRYTPHAAQHGFRHGVSAEHAILRALRSTRTRDGPVALLDIKGAYPSVPRHILVTLVRDKVDPLLADMLTVLLAPTRVVTIGDPTETVVETYRGLTQGDLKATTLFSLYIDPLLYELDPAGTMDHVVAFADDVTLTPHNECHLQLQLQVCTRWGWDARMSWSVRKSCVVAPPGRTASVRLSSEVLPVAYTGRLLGVQISAGRNAEVLPTGTLERMKTTIGMIARWKKAIRLHQRHPQYAWRRAMLHKFIRPLAEFGLMLATWTPELHATVLRYDRQAAEFVLGHSTRMPTDRVQAIFRLQGGELRRRVLATNFGLRLRQRMITASNEDRRQEMLQLERRALDYRTHRPIVEAVIRELTVGISYQAVWRQMLDGPTTRMARRIPLTILTKRYGQALLPPMLQNRRETANTRAAFLAVQFYLNHFPQGLGRARRVLGMAEAEQKFARLSSLLTCEELTVAEAKEAKDILNILHECEELAQA